MVPGNGGNAGRGENQDENADERRPGEFPTRCPIHHLHAIVPCNLDLQDVAIARDGAINHGVDEYSEAQARDQSGDNDDGEWALCI